MRSIIFGTVLKGVDFSDRGECARVQVNGDPYVSPTHCLVTEVRAGEFRVEDLGSTNGTRVRKASGWTVPIVGRRGYALERGDRVIIGRTTLPWVA